MSNHKIGPATNCAALRLFVCIGFLSIGLCLLLSGQGCSTFSSVSAKLYDIKTGDAIQVFSGGGRVTYFAAFSPDGSKILTGWPDVPTLWDVRTGQKIQSLSKRDFCKRPFSTSQSMFMVSFSPDGTKAITANADGTATVWNIESRTEWKTYCSDDYFGVTFVGFAPGGTEALIGRSIRSAIWLDVPSGKVSRVFDTGGSLILALSPDGTRIISTKGVHDALGGSVICSFANQTRLLHAAFSPDGGTVFTAGSDGLKASDAATCALKNVISEERESFYNISPDGRLALTGKWDDRLQLWDLKTRKMIRTFPGPVRGAVFSPDSRSIFALGYGKRKGH